MRRVRKPAASKLKMGVDQSGVLKRSCDKRESGLSQAEIRQQKAGKSKDRTRPRSTDFARCEISVTGAERRQVW